MSSFSAIFGNSAEKSPRDDDKLMDLYWNRNELKKEFARLREDNFKLKDRLSSHKGDLARLDQKLQHLEGLLIDPEWARSILVLYQLRGLGQRCTRKIARFAEQLKQQREQKQLGSALAKWRAGIDAEVAAMLADVEKISIQESRIDDQLKSLQRSLENNQGVLGFFRRRSLNKRVDACHEKRQALVTQQAGCAEQIQAIRDQQPPETVGLGISAKRSINFMIMAFAQQIYAAFEDDDLAMMVKESLERSAGGVRYGNAEDCEVLLRRIARSSRLLDKSADFASVLQRRAKLLSQAAVYQNDEDAVPLPGSVTLLCRFDKDGQVSTSDLDLLGGNVWGLATAMSR